MRRLILLFLVFIILLPINGFADEQTTYGPTTKADQLWQIAIMVRPDASVSIQQTMLAILQENPQAFESENVNSLKPGFVLKIPSLAEIQQLTSNEAASKINDSALQKPTSNIDNQQLDQLQTQFANVGKALLNFDQQYQARIANLQQQISELSTKVNQLKQPSKLELFFSPYIKYLQKSLGETGLALLLGVIIVVLLFLIWWVWPWRRKKVSKKMETDDIESEYDFMGSKEGIPAKLDLARAYIDMDDKQAAQEVLAEIIAKGNIEQQAEAKKLLEQIK